MSSVQFAMNTVTEQEFITRLRGGDMDSFITLYERYGKKIYNLAFRITGEHQDAEDITQEVFLKALLNIQEFKGESGIYTWLFRITKNSCYSSLKNKKRPTFEQMENLTGGIENQPQPDNLTLTEKKLLTDQVKNGCLTGLLKCLSFNQRTAFILNVFADLSIKNIAAILQKSEGAVKVLIHRARKNLKNFLCKNCSIYDPANRCRCQNLIAFSLEKGWIKKPGKEIVEKKKRKSESSEKSDSSYTGLIAEELENIRKISLLYTGLRDTNPPQKLEDQILELIKNSNFLIFNPEKV